MLATGTPNSDSDEVARVALYKHKQLSPQQSEKKRKISHATRKELLEEEIKILESGVAVMKTRGLPAQLKVLDDPVLLPMVQENAALRYSLLSQQLRVAKMQSAISQCLTDHQFYPLYRRITLGDDWDERRSTLLSMQKERLHNALEFVTALDPETPLFSEHRFETAQGDLCCVRYETIQFPGVASLEQVFEAVSFYKNNMEIIVSEQLGHVTLRDDYDEVDSSAFNTRILSTNERGITTEGNVVSFRHLFRNGEDGYEGEPCAVLTANSVDLDERYPYVSAERIRKDISTAVVLTASRKLTPEGPGSELIVAMRRVAFMKLRRPEFSMSEQVFDEIRDEVAQWCGLMLKTVRGIVYNNTGF